MAATITSLAVNDSNPTDSDGLPTLLSRLGDDVLQLINSQLALFKVELKEEANTYIPGAITIALPRDRSDWFCAA